MVAREIFPIHPSFRIIAIRPVLLFVDFLKYHDNVKREIRELRVIFEATEAKNKERIWLRNQTTGDLDDTHLIEGVTGEKAVYKRRGENTDDPTFQQKPKKMFFSVDLCASMMRFNGYDSRLDHSLECALRRVGARIELVPEGKYPKNEKDIYDILSRMNAHAQYCLSGDITLAAVTNAVKDVVKEEADDYFVLVLSDANIAQYNLSPASLAKELKGHDRVNAFMVFIGSLQDQADQLSVGSFVVLVKAMPGSAFVCLDNKELPKIIKAIFTESMLKGL
ncbi:von Willebrand factor A domain-containing protein 8 [Cladochytrium tenue]|nr:von Willebrand factor A domain-containing protein 8 [Cladochytrium tenue]